MAFYSLLCCVKGSSDRKVKKQLKWRIFSLKELHSATNNFNYDNKLGEGGFGSVYWGQLWDGSQIAVKRLKVWSNKPEVDFTIEIEILARVQHKNLLNLRGYCAQGQERLVVYDYMPNLNLFSHLHGHNSAECILDWRRRMNIALGAAEGIAYLHHHATPHIIHRYIKPSNVLLDSDFQARVADFGFSKFIPDGAAQHDTTRGYTAPEYAMTGNWKASESSDVYSFGILLLELVTGKKPIQKISETEKRSIADWALPLAKQRKFSDLVDEKLNGVYVEDELKRVVFMSLICAQVRPEKRPTMLDVVELLKGNSKEKINELEKSELFENVEVTGYEDGDLGAEKSDCGIYKQKEGKEESGKLQENEEIEKV